MAFGQRGESSSRNKELFPKGRGREGSVCGPACIMGVPLHSLLNPKQSTNRVAHIQGKSTVLLLAGRGLGAWREDQPRASSDQARQSRSRATVLKLDQGKVCLRLYNHPPPPPHQWKQVLSSSYIMNTDFDSSPETSFLKW